VRGSWFPMLADFWFRRRDLASGGPSCLHTGWHCCAEYLAWLGKTFEVSA
jgi:hypothetical protein